VLQAQVKVMGVIQAVISPLRERQGGVDGKNSNEPEREQRRQDKRGGRRPALDPRAHPPQELSTEEQGAREEKRQPEAGAHEDGAEGDKRSSRH